MTNKEIKEQLQKENSLMLKETLIQGLIFTIVTIIGIVSIINGDLNKLFIIMILGTGAWALFQDYMFISDFILYLNPFNSPKLKRFGTPEEITSIIRKLLKNADYKDDVIIMSQKYICGKDNFSSLMALKDIISVHKIGTLETSFLSISVKDKYGKEAIFTYEYDSNKKKTNSLVDNVIKMIRERSKNLTDDHNEEIEDDDYETVDNEEEYFTCDNCGAKVKEDANKCPKCGVVFEDDEDDEETDAEDDFEEDLEDDDFFTCDNCGAKVKEDANKCPKCGVIFEEDDAEEDDDDDDYDDEEEADFDETEDDEDEEEVEEEKNNSNILLDDKYDSLVKLKDLLDKDIITKEEFDKEKKKILR